MTATPADEAAFRQRMAYDGDLSQLLAEHIWDLGRPFRLGGDEFEAVGCEEVPGYEDQDGMVLLRRKSDGQVFEADIEVSVRPVLTPEQLEEQRGQLRLAMTKGPAS